MSARAEGSRGYQRVLWVPHTARSRPSRAGRAMGAILYHRRHFVPQAPSCTIGTILYHRCHLVPQARLAGGSGEPNLPLLQPSLLQEAWRSGRERRTATAFNKHSEFSLKLQNVCAVPGCSGLTDSTNVEWNGFSRPCPSPD